MNTLRIKKITAFSLVFALVMGIFFFSESFIPTTYADLQSDLENKQSELEDELNAVEEDLAGYKDDAKQTEDYLAQYDEKMRIQEETIANLEEQISVLDQEVIALSADIAAKEVEIADGVELFKERLKLLYVSGSTSYASVLVGASDFYDMLARMEMVRRISKQDSDMIEELEYQIELLDIDKQTLALKLESASDKKIKAEQYYAELEITYQNHEKTKAEQEAMIADYMERADEIEAEQEKLEEELQAEIRRKQEEAEKRRQEEERKRQEALKKGQDYSGQTMFTSYSETGFIWPAPTVRSTGDMYGDRWIIEEQRSDFHKGIDITNPHDEGEPIIASAGGEVIRAQTGWGGGYGWNIIIDHGNGISTVYCHCQADSFKVKVGDYVKQGQVIAAIGNTGNSYGAHLHFEVRVDGQHTDPMNYVSKTN